MYLLRVFFNKKSKHKNSFPLDTPYLIILLSSILFQIIIFLYNDKGLNLVTVFLFFLLKAGQFLFFFYRLIPYMINKRKTDEYYTGVAETYLTSVVCMVIDMAIFKLRLLVFPEEAYNMSLSFQIGFFLAVNLLIYNVSTIAYLLCYNVDLSKVNKKSIFQKKEMEIINAQQQINPHYLSNALDNLQALIRNKNYEGAMKYNAELSRLFNIQAKFSNSEFISIEEEINWLTSYLEVEKGRTNIDFEYSFSVEPEDLKLGKIPSLFIQPIIENSIIHGFTNSIEKKWKIEVRFQEISKTEIMIAVIDNGLGTNSIGSKSKGSKISMKNIKKRIELINELDVLHIRFEHLLTTQGAETYFYIKEK